MDTAYASRPSSYPFEVVNLVYLDPIQPKNPVLPR